MFEEYIPFLPVSKDIKVLDIGCGDGSLIEELIRLGFKDACGVDSDDAAVEVSRRKGLEVDKTADLAGFLASREGRYGLVVSREVIYYFSEQEMVPYLKAIRASLVPGGIFIAEVFNGAILTSRFVKDKDHGIRVIFTEGSLRTALEQSGFHIKAIFGNMPARGGLKRTIWRSAQSCWFWVLRGIYMLERGADPNNPKIFSKSIIAIAEN